MMNSRGAGAAARSKKGGRGGPLSVELVPDAPILIQARIKAGEPTLRIKEIANLILHDPVLTMEFLQYANSVMFSGAAQVTSIDSAVSRLGTDRLVTLLAELNSRSKFTDDDVADMFEVLRYNCRRTSIVAMIVAAAARPTLTDAARIGGLLCDIGHMTVLMHLGTPYCEAARQYRRKNLVFRLQKDHGLDVADLRIRFLRSKGIPERLVQVFDDEQGVKTTADADLRFCVQAATEIVEAADSERLEKYAPDEALPSQSKLRLLQLSRVQQERIYQGCSAYLKKLSEEEAPEGAGLLISSLEDEEQGAREGVGEGFTVPSYPGTNLRSKTRERLQELFDLCEREKQAEVLQEKAVTYLQQSGLYSRCAVVRVVPEAKEAVIEHAVGMEYDSGDTVPIADSLSPFYLFQLQIKSTNVKHESLSAPFGVAAYAVGPMGEVGEGERVLLYADTAGEESLTLEMRRAFRLILGMLAQTLLLRRRENAEPD